MFLDHRFVQFIRPRLCALLVTALIGTLPLAASANPPMVPQRDAQAAFGGRLPARDAALLDASLASHIERQQLLNSRHLSGSTLRTLDFFAKTFTVVRGGQRTVFDAELLGTWWPEDRRWEWTAVERTWNDPDLKDPKRKSFATGSAQTRLYGREHGIDILQADTAQLASELVAGGPEGQKAVVKRYYLLSHPKVTAASASDSGKAKTPAR
ncbi:MULTISPECIES: DUF6882 domain-containing protein [unclassified Acidovorax]|uniref:DUF6882 domain-containing protein n=1 Tax=unclassified Acidovorax TaxID=2684926 RepID=UPI0006FE79EA|nr:MULTISPECIES: DUF6882 domain-containing protein [unclassified Acidovorax]KRB41448.1 hypothetical protein ASD94_15550 [Acidovorax sp. Root70]PUA96153.1 hypothetical protein C8C99_0964 [Acidovorax sp. 107]